LAPVIGGAQWSISASPDTAAAMVVAIGARPSPDVRAADVRVDVRSSCVPLACDPHAVLAHRAGPFTTHVTPFGVYLFDADTGTGCFMVQKSTGVRAMLGTNVLFPIITWWARTRGLVPVHAATLGVGGSYWLIPAASGSGKSVACVLGRAAGLQSLGDDVVLWDPATRTLHAVYETVRVTQDGLTLVTDYLDSAGLRHEGFRHDGKALLVTNEPGPRSGTLAGILMIGESEPSTAAAHRQMLSTLTMVASTGTDPRPASSELARLARTAQVRAVMRRDGLDDWTRTLIGACGV
jgi:hypothetical protein